MPGKRPILTALPGDESFDSIRERLSSEIIGAIDRFGFSQDQVGQANPKMAMSLVRGIESDIEMHYRKETLAYVARRLDEQIAQYVSFGFHSAAGYTEESFRMMLAPLLESAMEFFSPPSVRPMRDGEYTLLLILPPQMVPVRRLLAEFLGTDVPTEFNALHVDVRGSGRATPDTPYILVGIDGGRGLKEFSIARADEWVTRNERVHFALHEMIQLFLIRPNFLSAESDFLLAQNEAVVLGERCLHGLVKFRALNTGKQAVFVDEKNVHGGVGVGKPHYAAVII